MQPTFRIGVETFETACNLPSFRTARWQPALPPVVADLDAELNRFAKLGVEELRALWRERRGQEPPEALSKDLTPVPMESEVEVRLAETQMVQGHIIQKGRHDRIAE